MKLYFFQYKKVCKQELKNNIILIYFHQVRRGGGGWWFLSGNVHYKCKLFMVLSFAVFELGLGDGLGSNRELRRFLPALEVRRRKIEIKLMKQALF